MTCVYICFYETTTMTKVHKWTSSSHVDALKLLSSQVDEFITNGRVHPMGMP